MTNSLVLLIAYHFPPDTVIGAARPWRFYKYLKRLGHRCVVLTASKQEPGADEDVIYIPDPLRVHPRQGLAWHAERVSWKVLLGVQQFLGWSDAAYRVGKQLLDRTKSERVTIISTAPPAGTLFAGLRLAAHSGHAWVADFRDPLEPPGARAILQNVFGPAIEKFVLNRADLVLANTDAMQERWRINYPDAQEKVRLMWNGFDPEDEIRSYALPFRAKKILSHVGELYGGRDMSPVLRALKSLLENRSLPADSIMIRQVGEIDQSSRPDENLVRAGTQAGWLELVDPVPPAAARAIALESDGLLLIPHLLNYQVPGKLYEYIRIGRPIFAYIVRDSPVERILERAGIPFVCAYPDHSAAEFEARLLNFVSLLRSAPAEPSQWFMETFDGMKQTKALDQHLRSLVAR